MKSATLNSDVIALDVPRPFHSNAFWESLVRLGISPAEAAPEIPVYTEEEIAGEMTRARQRLDEEQREQRLQARLLAQDPDIPSHLRERRRTCIPQARPGITDKARY